jgi:hypothetical protein
MAGTNDIVNAWVILCTLLGVFITGAAEAIEVEATGIAPIIEQNVAKARRAALEEAKRGAVEQALGSYIESRTEVENFALAADKIYSTVQGRIDSYQVIDDEALDDETYRIIILAAFPDETLLTDTEQLLAKYHWHKKPRLLIKSVGEGGAAAGQAASQLKQGLERKFRAQGFDVFDLANSQGNNAGFQLDASTLLQTRESDYQGVSLSNTEMSVSTTLTRVGSRQIISSASYNGSRPGANMAKALKALAGEGARELYSELSQQLNEEWLRHQDRGSNIVLQLEGTELNSKVPMIKSELRDLLRGLQSVMVVSSTANSAEMSVVYQGWPEQMYEELTRAVSSRAQSSLAVQGLQGDTLKIKVL